MTALGASMHSLSPKGRTVELLRELIEHRNLSDGDRLPAESRMAQEFSVSRVTLRAALGVLEREGLVRRQRNVGCVRVKPMLPQNSLMSRTIALISSLAATDDPKNFGGRSDSVMSGILD